MEQGKWKKATQVSGYNEQARPIFRYLLFLSLSRSLRLHAVHGNRWTTIGKALGVSGRAAQDKFRSVTKREKKGEQAAGAKRFVGR